MAARFLSLCRELFESEFACLTGLFPGSELNTTLPRGGPSRAAVPSCTGWVPGSGVSLPHATEKRCSWFAAASLIGSASLARNHERNSVDRSATWQSRPAGGSIGLGINVYVAALRRSVRFLRRYSTKVLSPFFATMTQPFAAKFAARIR
jgi:hypothetical protein